MMHTKMVRTVTIYASSDDASEDDKHSDGDLSTLWVLDVRAV